MANDKQAKCEHPNLELDECDQLDEVDYYISKSVALAESSLSSPPPDYKAAYEELEGGIEHAKEVLREIADACDSGGEPEYAYKDVECNKMRDIVAHLSGTRIAAEEHLGIHRFDTTFRQSPSLSESGAESAHSRKMNTADKSELLPTQLPKEK